MNDLIRIAKQSVGVWAVLLGIIAIIHFSSDVLAPKPKPMKVQSLLHFPCGDFSPKIDPEIERHMSEEARARYQAAFNSPKVLEAIVKAKAACEKPMPMPLSVGDCQKMADELTESQDTMDAKAYCEPYPSDQRGLDSP